MDSCFCGYYDIEHKLCHELSISDRVAVAILTTATIYSATSSLWREKRMRICILHEYFDPDGPGGAPSMLPMLAQRLCMNYADVTVDVICSRNVYRGDVQDTRPAFETWKGVNVYRLSTPRSNQPNVKTRLLAGAYFTLCAWAKLATLPAYDLLLVATTPPMAPSAARVIAALKHTPYVYLVHDLFPDVAVAIGMLPAEHIITRFAYRAQRTWLQHAACVVAIGRCMQEHLSRTYSVAQERLTVIPNWADGEHITPRKKVTQFRTIHGLRGFVVLYAGNFGQHQNFDILLDAAKRLYAAGRRDITFLLVGDGAKRNQIADRIAREQISNVRQFPFVTTEMYPDLLASADVSLVTLEPGAEGVGVPSKFYSILASGRPVIATLGSTSEIARVIHEADCGVRVEQHDTDGLIAAIVNFAQSPSTCEQMGANARAVFESRFTLNYATERFYQTFCSVLTGKVHTYSGLCHHTTLSHQTESGQEDPILGGPDEVASYHIAKSVER